MTCSTSLSGKNRIFLIAGILMIATTLRVTFTGAAPLLYDSFRLLANDGANRLIDHPAIISLCADLTAGRPGGATFWYGT